MRDRRSWMDLAVEVEAAGLQGLYVADHPGSAPDPFVSLAAAAAVTQRIRLGTCVLNAGLCEPLALANAAASLDLLSQGRVTLGLGAGHTPQEWTAQGRPFPSPGERVNRLVELVQATGALLGSVEPVSYQGRYFTLQDAALAGPRPAPDGVSMLIGGNGDRVLRLAATQADVVGVTGLVRTLKDGHSHEVDWSPSTFARTMELIGSAAGRAGRQPALEALVQHIEITEDASELAARLAPLIPGASERHLLSAPYMWVGTVEEIRTKLVSHRNEWGLQRYVVRESALPQLGQILTGVDL